MGRVFWAGFLASAMVLAGLSLSDPWAQQQTQGELCLDDTERERLRTLMIEALDEGFKDQISHLYESWMKDATQQPARAAVGARNAINAYAHARRSVREWDPCKR